VTCKGGLISDCLTFVEVETNLGKNPAEVETTVEVVGMEGETHSVKNSSEVETPVEVVETPIKVVEIPGTCKLDTDCNDGKCITNSIPRRVCDCQKSLNSGEHCEVTP
jgi:hypothetical protein